VVHKGELRSNDPREIICRVFSSTEWVPAVVSDGFGRNVSVGSVRNDTPEGSSSVILVTTRNSTRRRTTSVANNLVSINNYPGKVACLVFFSAVWEPSLVSGCLGWNVSPL